MVYVYVGGMYSKSFHENINCPRLPVYDRRTLTQEDAIVRGFESCLVCSKSNRNPLKCTMTRCIAYNNGLCRVHDWVKTNRPQEIPISGCIQFDRGI